VIALGAAGGGLRRHWSHDQDAPITLLVLPLVQVASLEVFLSSRLLLCALLSPFLATSIMFPEELRTAIELKRAIEEAPYMLRPLGTSPSLNIAFHKIGYALKYLEECSDEMKESVTIPVGAKVRPCPPPSWR
jgi:hypothetical protein